MRLTVRAAILTFCCLLGARQLAAAEPTLTEAIEKLEAVADGFPPRVTDANRQEVMELWKWVESGMLQYRAGRSAPDENAEFLLGEIYRLGHNLDVPGAAEKAVSHFNAALAINPANSKAHLMLGRHLTFTGDDAGGQRELLLGVALDPRGASDRSLFDLAFNSYQQKQFALAAAFADRYLKMHPDDPGMKLIAEKSKDVLAGGKPPQTITIPREP